MGSVTVIGLIAYWSIAAATNESGDDNKNSDNKKVTKCDDSDSKEPKE